ncbi:MAG: zinc ribbon domain-containing protein [Anaerolineales bacterium]|nr:zinc ribbon domain-containing protein [Anaerolineales bacterium]
MFCAQCGTKLPEGAKFCPECGAAVKIQPAEAGMPGAGIDQDIQQVDKGGAALGSLQAEENSHPQVGGERRYGDDVRGDKQEIHTQGGAFVAGQVNTAGGDFIGRDKRVYGDEVHGDKVLGDKVSGDKISGDRYDVKMSGGTGIAIGRGAQAYVGGAGARQPGKPAQVAVQLLASAFPTAYSHLLLDAEAFPFITVSLDNSLPGCVESRLRLSAQIEGYSDPAVEMRNLAPGERLQVPLLPVLQREPVRSLTDIRPATLLVKVEQVDPEPRLLYEDAERIHLQGRDVALLAIRKPDGALIDHSDYLAAWVTPRVPAIERLLRKAVAYHPDGRFDGYQRSAAGPEAVNTQAQAIFSALKRDAGLAYISAALSLGGEQGYYTQRVRLPSHILEIGGSANCLDATVLFASLLELAMIEPLIAVIPGHAFLGWRLQPGGEAFEFLDSERVGSADFETARDFGRRLCTQALEAGWRDRPLFDPQGYFRLVDIAACRQKGIYPLE